jgi:anti-sigma28 factor (negative regulator of flagellin synthesis)
MSSINGLGGSSPIQPNQNITSKPVQAAVEPKTSATDRLELSGASHLLQTLKTNDVRTDKVAAIKAQIASGIYDADGSKLDAATGPLLDEILK